MLRKAWLEEREDRERSTGAECRAAPRACAGGRRRGVYTTYPEERHRLADELRLRNGFKAKTYGRCAATHQAAWNFLSGDILEMDRCHRLVWM
jgi:hypothetical protein